MPYSKRQTAYSSATKEPSASKVVPPFLKGGTFRNFLG